MKVTVSGVEVGDIPDGWQRCDGSVILEPSIWAGERTPDLNNERRFLRGGSDQEVLTLEEDMVQDHGHEVNDPGHTHSYEDSYYTGSSQYHRHFYDGDSGNHDAADHTRATKSGVSGISVNGVLNGRSGTETRPKNMNVVFIMRVY